MKVRALVLLLSAFSLFAIAGCSDNGGSGSSGSDQLTASTPEAQGNIDEVTWNLPAGEPASLDYSQTWDVASGNTVLANVCDNLMRQEPSGEIVPSLAESVETPNPTTYVYNLRQGVKFTDGSPVTAKDVAFSLNRQIDPDTASFWAVWFENVKSIDVTSPTQVTVKLTQPDVVFPEMMSTPAGAIVEQKYVEEKGAKFGTPSGGVMCSGPYSLEKWDAGKSITLKANSDYWDESLVPKTNTVVFTFTRDPAAITNALTTGEVDGTWQAPLAGYTQLVNSSSGTLFQNDSVRCSYMSMSSFDGGLADPKIRQALQQSIDYAGIVSGIYKGAGSPSRSLAPAPSWGYAKDVFSKGYDALPPAEQNIDGATSLVNEAGAPGEPIVIAYDAGDATAEAIVGSIQDSASKVGLQVESKGLPTATFGTLFFDPNSRKGIDAFFVTSQLDVPDPLELYVQLLPSSPYNYTGFSNPGFTKPIEQARRESDPTARANLVVEGQASAADIVQSLLPIACPHELLYLNKGVTGPPVSSLSSVYYPWAATLGSP